MMISRTKIIVIIIPLYGILLYSRTRIVDYNDQPTVVFGTLQGIFTETNGLQFSQVGIIIFLVLVFSFPPGVTFSLISEGELCCANCSYFDVSSAKHGCFRNKPFVHPKDQLQFLLLFNLSTLVFFR
jgi:hypothetical protein